MLSTPWLAASDSDFCPYAYSLKGERYDELAPDYRLNIIGCLSCKK
ncbi:hypothetical protein [Piscirickettsia salmonis]|nr:hypothetical protein [Piscirickettsia salmonis]QHS32362.1 hypothetical protein GW535_07500 [Piscirickettsia salmonis]QIX55777.1 hypothetical protein GW536_10375 [Piscirickettsia salmonis]